MPSLGRDFRAISSSNRCFKLDGGDIDGGDKEKSTDGESHICSRMFLGSRGHLPGIARRRLNPRRLHLLKVFWENHDPTQVNRQGPDWGTQYRTAIFFHTPQQRTEAEASKAALEKAHRYSKPIATQIVPAVTFYPAEDYHQQYLEKRGQASCHIKA